MKKVSSSRIVVKTSRLSVLVQTILCTLACMLASSTYAYFAFREFDGPILSKAMVSALILPIFIGAPSYFFLISRMRALAFRNMRLRAMGTRDGLTHCLNQTAFRNSVDAWLRGKGGFPIIQGALLVVDADHFKSINDTHGHQMGDEALKTIAEQVRSVVRHGDFVGRIGGEEFGVMLCGADYAVAELVAERIRASVTQAGLTVQGLHQPLSVSVGGVVFHTQTPFSTLFRKADDMLYAAKEAGRNRVCISRLMPASVTV